MTLNEIARRLYKPRWANHKEWKEALDAFEKLSDKDMEKVMLMAGNFKEK